MGFRELLIGVMIATGWIMAFAFLIAAMFFGYIAHAESQRCVDTYHEYLKEIDAKCTMNFGNVTNETFSPIKIKTAFGN